MVCVLLDEAGDTPITGALGLEGITEDFPQDTKSPPPQAWGEARGSVEGICAPLELHPEEQWEFCRDPGDSQKGWIPAWSTP